MGQRSREPRVEYTEFTQAVVVTDLMSWRSFILRDILKETCVSNEYRRVYKTISQS